MGIVSGDVTIVAPVPDPGYTGGHLVNDRLARHPRVTLLHAPTLDQAWSQLAGGATAPDRVGRDSRQSGPIIVDSLFLEETESIGRFCKGHGGPIGLMTHSLPSLLPDRTTNARRLSLAAEMQSLGLFDFFIVPSRFMKRALLRRGVAVTRIDEITPAPVVDGRSLTAAVDDSPTQSAPALVSRDSGAPVRILTIANWSPFKGIDVAWSALSEIADLDWRWRIVGKWDGSSFGRRLHTQIINGSTGDRITVDDPVAPEQLHDLYLDADIFLLPSSMESYGLVFAEALSHRVPVIATSAAAVPEVLGDFAQMSAVGDTSGLIGSLRRAIGNPAERARLAALAEEGAQRLPDWNWVRNRFVQAVDARAAGDGGSD